MDKKQPVLYVNRHEGEKTYLPTQLCHEASLPVNFTKDGFKMRQIQPYKISTAQKRKEKILKLVTQFGLLDRIEVFRDWQMNVNQNMAPVKGTKFGVPQIDHSGQIKSYEDY